MPNLWKELKEKLEALATGWASYVAVGSFALYMLGYLATRFHLTALGVGTDLSVLDEQYLFAGAKFLVYLISTATIPLLFALGFAVALWLAALLTYLPYRAVVRLAPRAAGLGEYLSWRKARLAGRFVGWWDDPARLSVAGIFVSVLFIQVVMRKCYSFANLLVAPDAPQDALGLEQLLLADSTLKMLYFGGLMVVTAFVVCILILAKNRLGGDPPAAPLTRFLVGLLAFLAVAQFLYLPINYGVFIMDKDLARVSALGDEKPLDPCRQEAWLVWESSQAVTYLLAEAAAPPPGAGETEQAKRPCITEAQLVGYKRSLVTLPRKDVKRWQIVGYDQIFRRIFADKGRQQ